MEDPNSQCNFREATVTHYHWTAEVDFPSKVLHCKAVLTVKALKDGCKQLVNLGTFSLGFSSSCQLLAGLQVAHKLFFLVALHTRSWTLVT